MDGNGPATPAQISGLLAHLLAGAAGGSADQWRERIGEVEQLPIATNVRCNWRVRPQGSAEQLDAIERAVELVRGQHPYVM